MQFLVGNRAYVIWACAALFYIYQFVLRVSPGLMLDDLMAYFQADASEVGSLSAAAMYAYSLFQIPAGVGVDRFGVRRVVLLSLLLCLLGVGLVVFSSQIGFAKVGRVLLGAGSAPAFLVVSKISTQWFLPHKRAILLGMTMSMGTIGAYFGSVSLSWMMSLMGWQSSLLVTSVFGIGVFVAAFFIIPQSKAMETQLEDIQLKSVLGSKDFWIYSATALGIYLCVSVIADLWGVSFIVQAYGVNKSTAAQMVSLIYVGLCFGSVALSYLGDRLQRRERVIQVSLFLLCVLACLLFYQVYFSIGVCSLIFFLIGFFAGAEMLCFSCLCERVSKDVTGTAVGSMNCVVMFGGAVIAEQVGRILDYFWQGQLHASGVRLYSTREFQISFSLIAVTIFVSFIATFFFPKQARELNI
jgi:MFS family permease